MAVSVARGIEAHLAVADIRLDPLCRAALQVAITAAACRLDNQAVAFFEGRRGLGRDPLLTAVGPPDHRTRRRTAAAAGETCCGAEMPLAAMRERELAVEHLVFAHD